MNILLSPHAQSLFHEILATIADELSHEDAAKWRIKILDNIELLGLFPNFGEVIPSKCFAVQPENCNNLLQTFCLPYRIVYEPCDNEIHVLSIRHCRQLLRETDTYWNDSPDEDLGADPDDLIYRS